MKIQKLRDRRWKVYIREGSLLSLTVELGRVRGLRWAYVGYGGQDAFAKASAGLGYGFWLTLATPFRWHRFRPRDGKYDESHAELGIRWSHGKLVLSFGHDLYGTYYSGGRRGIRQALRTTWQNRELSLWDNRWVTGRRRSRWVDVAEFPCVLDIGQWEGDAYTGTMKLRRLEWTQRWFRRGRRWDWEFSMPVPGPGIPVPGNPDSDFYDGDDWICGFGASADEHSLTEALARLKAMVIRDRGAWRPTGVGQLALGEKTA